MNSYLKFKISLPKAFYGLQAVSIALVWAGALFLLNRSNPGFIGVSPHPYLIFSILAGGLLGLERGFLISLTLAGLFGYFHSQSVDRMAVETVFTRSEVYFLIVMVSLASAVGAMSHRLRDKIEILLSKIKRREKLIAELESVNATLSKERTEIEKKVTGGLHVISRVFNYAAQLESNDPVEVSRVILDLVLEETKESMGYLYLATGDDQWTRQVFESTSEPLNEVYPTQELDILVRTAIESKACVRADQLAFGEATAFPQGIASPLVSMGGKVIGFVFVPEVSFLNYVPETFSVFDSAVRWGGVCLGRTLRHRELGSISYRDEQTGLFSYQYSTKQIEASFQLAKKYSLPLSLIEWSIVGFDKLLPIERLPVTKLLGEIIERHSRVMDSVSVGDKPGRFLSLMMIASPKEVAEYQGRVSAEFQKMQESLEVLQGCKLTSLERKILGEHRTVEDFAGPRERKAA